MQMTLADDCTQTTEILTTSVDIGIQGKVIATELIILKNAKGNRKYNFVKAPPNINALLTVDTKPHPCQLRENEEECESPYASPVVLIPKPNGTFRLCIDYRKLNEITVADTYPLPRMDDLLHQAKLTPFMSTLDLRAGHHQVKVHVEDQDKTAFVCPFGTYRYVRMPYGLRNAPATFQRLMNRFCNGLEDILALPYLDDIIVLSETFEKHVFDLKAIFERLLLFKLKANREKCHFASSRVKYLGFWITQKGIEVDPEKVASILYIPPPKNVKEVQSFLQTCSWFRRYIQDFAKISRPLSYLTKKKVQWQWGFDQQNAFQILKNCLTTPPVRLLTPAERNYSTTEREVLAVVWALKKFRGYIEGTEITVASDHQPLKWLLNLKSPTGRLARWALEIQSFNLKVQYIPGKANVVADMLSRPVTQEECFYEANNITIADILTRSCKDMREAQHKNDNLKKNHRHFRIPSEN
ncbi:retrovirus-related Pol polyprotein from transposon 17.6 [Trichonephila clavipes]|nr:retrovirus-related Pol polyprotein from transposon 17.6 [Trichonephila clavipes]